MFDSVVVDVVIALTLIFLVFSLVTSGVRELVARILETRAKELWRSMRRLLEDPISSDFRDIRALAAGAEGEAQTALLEAVGDAEEALRRRQAEPSTAREWRSHVAEALDPIRGVAATHGLTAQAEPLLKGASRRLSVEHQPGRRTASALLRASRRGGARPRVPELPSRTTVGELADQVRTGTKTLTDAVHDHPSIRQIDRTWPGFESRMRELDGDEFSAAVVDVLRAAGFAPLMRPAMVEIGRALDALDLDDDQKERLWEPIAEAFDQVERLAIGAGATVDDYDRIVRSVTAQLERETGELHVPGPDIDEVRARIESAQRLVERLHDDPLALVRAGADALEDSAPVKEVVQGLVADARSVAEDARGRMLALRGSVGAWYDTRMANLSSWYRSRSRFVGFGLGLLVVVGFNVDAIEIPQELWHNENMRDLVVALADTETAGLDTCQTDPDPLTCVEKKVDQLVETGLPIGWDIGTDCGGTCSGITERISFAAGTAGEGPFGGLVKLAGWIVAAAGLAMGASFWYDVLTRATGIKKTMRGGAAKTAAAE